MRLLDRLMRLLTALLLLGVCVSLCAVWFFGWDLPGLMSRFRTEADLGWVLLAGVGAVLAGLAAVMSLLTPRLARARDQAYVVQRMGDDKVSVSRAVVEELALACVRDHKELEKGRVTVRSHRDGLAIGVTCRLRQGTDLSRSVDYIQRQIRRHVTDTTGLKVHEVSLKVESLTGAPLPIPELPDRDGAEAVLLPAGQGPRPGAKNAGKKRDKTKEPPQEPAAPEGAEGSQDMNPDPKEAQDDRSERDHSEDGRA